MGLERATDDAGHHDVRPRNDRDGRRGHAHRRVRFPRKADRAFEAADDDRARVQDGGDEGAASHIARDARHERAGSRCGEGARIAARGAPSGADPRRGGHRPRPRGARTANARIAVRRAGERRAPRQQSADAARGSARRRALLRGDRPVFARRAEGPRRSCCRSSTSTTSRSSRPAPSRSPTWPRKASSTPRCCRNCPRVRWCCRRYARAATTSRR